MDPVAILRGHETHFFSVFLATLAKGDQSVIPADQFFHIPARQIRIDNAAAFLTDHRSPITDHRSPITDHRSPITDDR